MISFIIILFKNFLLPIRIPQEIIESKLVPVVTSGHRLTIDLPNQQIRDGETDEVLIEHFDVEEFRKHCLVNGLDDIGLTLQKKNTLKNMKLKEESSFLLGRRF